MGTKDYIYLALTVLAALVGYLHGLRTGVRRCRKVLVRFFEVSDALQELPPADTEATPNKPQHHRLRGPEISFSKTAIRGLFGRN